MHLHEVRVLHWSAFTIWVICMHYAGDKWKMNKAFLLCVWDTCVRLGLEVKQVEHLIQHLVFTTVTAFIFIWSSGHRYPGRADFELSWQPSVILDTTRSGKDVHNMETRAMTLCPTSFYKTSFFRDTRKKLWKTALLRKPPNRDALLSPALSNSPCSWGTDLS